MNVIFDDRSAFFIILLMCEKNYVICIVDTECSYLLSIFVPVFDHKSF